MIAHDPCQHIPDASRAGFAVSAQDKPDETLSAVVGVSAKIQANARSAESLGTQRRGTGVLIREGYVLTIGYLVIEAEAIQVTGADGRTVPATLAGYDHASGFGLLRVVGPFSGTAAETWRLRRARRARAGDGGHGDGAGQSEPGVRGVAPAVLRQLGIPARLGDLHLPAGHGLVGRAAHRRRRRSARHRLADRPRRGRAGDAIARQHVRAGGSAQADPRGPHRQGPAQRRGAARGSA